VTFEHGNTLVLGENLGVPAVSGAAGAGHIGSGGVGGG
jgi:hypothetical protein